MMWEVYTALGRCGTYNSYGKIRKDGGQDATTWSGKRLCGAGRVRKPTRFGAL